MKLDNELSESFAKISEWPTGATTTIANQCMTLHVMENKVGLDLVECVLDDFQSYLSAVVQRLNPDANCVIEDDDEDKATTHREVIQALSSAEDQMEELAVNYSALLFAVFIQLREFRNENLSSTFFEAMSRLRISIVRAAGGELEDDIIIETTKVLVSVLGEEFADLIQLNRLKRWIVKPSFALLGKKKVNVDLNSTDLKLLLENLFKDLEFQVRELQKTSDLAETKTHEFLNSLL